MRGVRSRSEFDLNTIPTRRRQSLDWNLVCRRFAGLAGSQFCRMKASSQSADTPALRCQPLRSLARPSGGSQENQSQSLSAVEAELHCTACSPLKIASTQLLLLIFLLAVQQSQSSTVLTCPAYSILQLHGVGVLLSTALLWSALFFQSRARWFCLTAQHRKRK
jgi:hypothetical protein